MKTTITARFARAFPAREAGAPITFDDVGRAIAEFEFTLVFTGRADRSLCARRITP
jgi:cytochrome c peroxidase